MGNQLASDERDHLHSDPLQHFYDASAGKLEGDEPVAVGGGDCGCNPVVGGYKGLIEYGNSRFAAGKEKLIRDIASDAYKAIDRKKPFSDSDPIDKVISALKGILMDPKGKKLKPTSAGQAAICKRLAHVINKRYGMQMIDESDDPQSICVKVSELLYSLFTGLQTEFFHVSGDVARLTKNLQILHRIVDEIFGRLSREMQEMIEYSDGSVVNIKEVYDKISAEINRQLGLLNNVVGSTISPLQGQLTAMLVDNNDFVGLTEDLTDLSKAEFGRRLGYLLTGVGDVAHASHLVNNALKQLGMSAAEYKRADSMKDLRQRIYDHLVKKHPSSDDLKKMLIAADILYKNDLAHEDIADYISKHKLGGAAPFDADDFDRIDLARPSDSLADAMWEDPSNTPFVGRRNAYRKSVGKQVVEQARFRRILFADFHKMLKQKYQEFVFSLEKLARKLDPSTSAPKVENLIRLLKGFAASQPNKKNLHIALSGYRTDTFSVYNKTQFMEYLHLIMEEAKELSSKKNDGFGEIAKACVDIIKLVDEFNMTFTNTLTDHRISIDRPHKRKTSIFGGDEEESKDDSAEEVEDAMAKETEEAMAKEVLGGIIDDAPEADFRHYDTLSRAVLDLEYNYRRANLISDLNRVAKDNAENVSRYEEVLGEDAAPMQDNIIKRCNALVAAVYGNSLTEYGFADEAKLYLNGWESVAGAAAVVSIDTNILAKDSLKNHIAGYKHILEYIRDARLAMVDAAQALDLYLSKFTQKIELNPDALLEFKAILADLTLIDKWFTQASGNSMLAVFEAFSNSAFPANPAALENIFGYNKPAGADLPILGAVPAAAAAADDAAAYRLSKTNSNARLPLTQPFKSDDVQPCTANPSGIAFAPRLMTLEEAREFISRIADSVSNMKALDNICSLFAKIGHHIDDGVQTFMSNGMIKNVLEKYMVASIIGVGYRLKQDGKIVGFANTQYNILSRMGITLRLNQEFSLYRPAVDGGAAEIRIQFCDPLEIGSKVITSECDKLFEMCLKSMISKIYVTLDSFAVFNRLPKSVVSADAATMITSPIRQIMGGAPSSVKVYHAAAELYIRLPLLAEWYRKVFEFDRDDRKNDDDMSHQFDPLVSIVPEMNSIWGPLCKVIFIDGRKVQDGGYSAEQSNNIIEAISNIYKAHERMSCRDIIVEFVREINRRYGFMMRSEIQTYLAARERNFKTEDYSGEDPVDLPSALDDEPQLGRRPAPSDKYRTQSAKLMPNKKLEREKFQAAVRRFRHSVMENLQISGQDGLVLSDLEVRRNYTESSMTHLVEMLNKRIAEARSDDEKYSIVHGQLHGTEKYADIDQTKLLAFHENVITPMTVLYMTYLILNDYNKFMNSLNLEKWDEAVDLFLEGKYYDDDFKEMADGAPRSCVGVFGPHVRQHLASILLKQANDRYKGNGNPFKRKMSANVELLDAQQAEDYISAMCPVDVNGYLAAAVVQLESIVAIADAGEKHAVASRLLLNRSALMDSVLRRIMNISLDLNKLVGVSFVDAGAARYPTLDMTAMERVCNSLFQTMRNSLQMAKQNGIPLSIIAQIENVLLPAGAGAVAAPAEDVSLFWLQQNLMDRLFKNMYGNGLQDANTALQKIWNELTREHKFNWIEGAAAAAPAIRPVRVSGNGAAAVAADMGGAAIGAAEAGAQRAGLVQEDFYYDSYNSVLSKLCFWDNSNEDNIPVDELGKRIVSLSNDINSFPIQFVPIYKNGGSIASPMSKFETETANATVMSSTVLDDAMTNSLNPGVVDMFKIPADDAAGAPAQVYLTLGCHNLYDFDAGLSSGSNLIGGGGTIAGRDYGGKNHLHHAAAAPMRNSLASKLGLLPRFNAILYHYMLAFIHPTTKQIYGPLINGMVHGHNAKDIQHGKNINDRVIKAVDAHDKADWEDADFNGATSAVCKFEPPENATIFASLAGGIRGIAMGINSNVPVGKAQSFIEEDIKNVDPIILEMMRAYLPLFEKQLEMMINRASFLKEVIENTRCKVYRWRVRLPIDGDLKYQTVPENDQHYTQPLRIPKPEPEASRKTYLTNMMADLMVSARSLLQCIQTSAKALGDIPLYFETYAGSMTDYKNRHGYLPLTPLSSITHLLNPESLRYNRISGELADPIAPPAPPAPPINDTNIRYRIPVLPEATEGYASYQFKLAYGTRGVLSHLQGPDPTFAPGAAELMGAGKVGGYHDVDASVEGGASMYDKKMVSDTIRDVLHLSRYAVDYMYHAQFLDQQMYGRIRPKVNARNLTCQMGKSGDGQFWRRIENITLLSDNDNHKQAVYRLVACLRGAGNKIYGSDRNRLRVFNIFDLQIVPINFHALQREIPFINLQNYSYTFDHIVQHTIGNAYKSVKLSSIHGIEPVGPRFDPYDAEQNEGTYIDDEYKALTNTDDAMVRYLMFPNGYRRWKEYAVFGWDALIGATTKSLKGVPRFASDQLANKVLMLPVIKRGEQDILRNRIPSAPAALQPAGFNRTPLFMEDARDARNTAFPRAAADMTACAVTNHPIDLGYSRYNTKYVRWTEWIVHLQRLCVKLMKDVRQTLASPIAIEDEIVRDRMTDYPEMDRAMDEHVIINLKEYE